jgi:hypothetical protein
MWSRCERESHSRGSVEITQVLGKEELNRLIKVCVVI